jgi:5-oxoprolinase (ATP-hydrolysing) subunit A
MVIDINCDIGEGISSDAAIMPYISSANIACGYHAGDEHTIRQTIDLCLKHNVAIGAHPGFDDRVNFGRVELNLSKEELYALVWKQLEIMQRMCDEKNATLHHVKPHGALYNMAAKDKSISHSIAKAVYDFNPDLIYYGLSGSWLITEARAIGLMTANEVFADRTYMPDGTLTPRSQPNALIEESDDAVKQILQLLTSNSVNTITGEIIPLKADTICIHGDGAQALEFATTIHTTLKLQGIQIRCKGNHNADGLCSTMLQL